MLQKLTPHAQSTSSCIWAALAEEFWATGHEVMLALPQGPCVTGIPWPLWAWCMQGLLLLIQEAAGVQRGFKQGSELGSMGYIWAPSGGGPHGVLTEFIPAFKN